jgi:glycine/D-amino acid oxidase-like deaminating enzyme
MVSRKVCVVGAGVIGLSSAVRIQNTLPDVDVTLIADIFSPNTTSDGSAGFWEPHLVNPDQVEDIRFAKLFVVVFGENISAIRVTSTSGNVFCILTADDNPMTPAPTTQTFLDTIT